MVRASVAKNQDKLRDLFLGGATRRAIIMDAPEADPPDGDFVLSDADIERWRDWGLRRYEAELAYHEALGDDSVPYVITNTNTGVFAAAFGCPLHAYREKTNAAARPIVSEAAQADALAEPSLDAPSLQRVFAYAGMMREALGPDVPIAVPDIQSPFDIAALVWNKEDFFVALRTDPDSVLRLVGKCERLLVKFVDAYVEAIDNVNFCHCPRAWAPRELGFWLSEDEIGAISPVMFAQFCAPSLERLSIHYGGLFIHCCAHAAHQYPGLRRLPKLRALNRVFVDPGGPAQALQAFPDQVFMVAWTGLAGVRRMLEQSPSSRFLFNMPAEPLPQARQTYAELRELCERI